MAAAVLATFDLTKGRFFLRVGGLALLPYLHAGMWALASVMN